MACRSGLEQDLAELVSNCNMIRCARPNCAIAEGLPTILQRSIVRGLAKRPFRENKAAPGGVPGQECEATMMLQFECGRAPTKELPRRDAARQAGAALR